MTNSRDEYRDDFYSKVVELERVSKARDEYYAYGKKLEAKLNGVENELTSVRESLVHSDRDCVILDRERKKLEEKLNKSTKKICELEAIISNKFLRVPGSTFSSSSSSEDMES